MTLRTWRVWGVSAVLAGGVVALAQSPKSEVSGRSTPPLTQDHFQPESAPPPRELPQQVRESKPSKTAPPTTGNVIGLQAPGVPTPDLDVPIRVVSIGPSIAPAAIGELARDWKARAALDIAEMHFEACELDDARRWYLEVLKLAPGTKAAAVAERRLNQSKVIPAGGETREPPLADLGSTTRPIPIP